tara:strand:- start:2991 stop:3233 length:243 start_codon:yes stop_codon:yes gene_type:complete
MLKEVKVKVGDEFIRGALYKGELLIANVLEVGETINVDGKEMKVLSSTVDYRDNLLKIKVLAKASLPKEKKSDGKQQTKG